MAEVIAIVACLYGAFMTVRLFQECVLRLRAESKLIDAEEYRARTEHQRRTAAAKGRAAQQRRREELRALRDRKTAELRGE